MRRITKLLFVFTGLAGVTFQCQPELRRDFPKDLEEKLSYAVNNFEPQNKAFILNVMTPTRETILQIVHRSYAKQTRHEKDSFGFALQVTFPAHSREMKAYEKFKAAPFSSDFIFYEYEDIPCYVIDLDKDIVKTVQLTENLLAEVYAFRRTKEFVVELTDEGEVKNWIQE